MVVVAIIIMVIMDFVSNPPARLLWFSRVYILEF